MKVWYYQPPTVQQYKQCERAAERATTDTVGSYCSARAIRLLE